MFWGSFVGIDWDPSLGSFVGIFCWDLSLGSFVGIFRLGFLAWDLSLRSFGLDLSALELSIWDLRLEELGGALFLKILSRNPSR